MVTAATPARARLRSDFSLLVALDEFLHGLVITPGDMHGLLEVMERQDADDGGWLRARLRALVDTNAGGVAASSRNLRLILWPGLDKDERITEQHEAEAQGSLLASRLCLALSDADGRHGFLAGQASRLGEKARATRAHGG